MVMVYDAQESVIHAMIDFEWLYSIPLRSPTVGLPYFSSARGGGGDCGAEVMPRFTYNFA